MGWDRHDEIRRLKNACFDRGCNLIRKLLS
jgi:hypothetical protein